MSRKSTFSNHNFSPQLIAGIKAGDKKRFSDFYDKCAPALLGIVYGILNTDDLAERALKNTFTSIRLGMISGDLTHSNICGWMMRIARSEASKMSLGQPSNKKNNLSTNPTALSIALLGRYSLSEVAKKLCLSESDTMKAIREELKNANGHKG